MWFASVPKKNGSIATRYGLQSSVHSYLHSCLNSRGIVACRASGKSAGTKKNYDGLDSIRHLTNFGRSVLGCIEAYDSETRRIFQHFSKSTRCAFLCTTRNSIF